MFPTRPGPIKRSGGPNAGWFSALVAFPVKSKKKPSRMVNVFASDIFTVNSPGPFRMFLPILPNVPGVGAAKALTSNHRLIVGFSRFGFPTTFGYQELLVDRLKLLLTAMTGVKGLPD